MAADGDGKKVCVMGACFTDLIAYVPRLPAPGETLVGSKFATGFGGKGANQAVQAARLGSSVLMVSKVGDDTFGNDTLKNFERQGVDATYVLQAPGISSGVAPIAVDVTTGQNSIIIVPGALDLLTAADVEAARPGIRTCSVMVCQLEAPMEATLAALRVAKEEGLTTILNTAPAPPGGKLPEEIWPLCDIICPNEQELQGLTGMPSGTDDEVAAAAAEVQRRGAKKVLVTLGERGAALFEGGSAKFVPAVAVDAKDTTGAGDSFLGALVHYVQSGAPLLDAMAMAIQVASLSVTREGTQTSFPDAAEMQERKRKAEEMGAASL